MDLKKQDLEFRYSLLSRMVQDIGYCIRLINNANEDGRDVDIKFILDNHLSGSSDRHFSDMKNILLSFTEKELPEWYSLSELSKDKNRLEAMTGLSLG